MLPLPGRLGYACGSDDVLTEPGRKDHGGNAEKEKTGSDDGNDRKRLAEHGAGGPPEDAVDSRSDSKQRIRMQEPES